MASIDVYEENESGQSLLDGFTPEELEKDDKEENKKPKKTRIGDGFTASHELKSQINKVIREKRWKQAEENREMDSKVEQMIEDANLDQETKEILKNWERPRNPELGKMGSRDTLKRLLEIEQKRYKIENEDVKAPEELKNKEEKSFEPVFEPNTSKSFAKRVERHKNLKEMAKDVENVTYEKDTKKEKTYIIASTSFNPPINYDLDTRRSKEYVETIRKVDEAIEEEQQETKNSGFQDTDFWLNRSQSGNSIKTKYRKHKVFANAGEIRDLLEGEAEEVAFSRPVNKWNGETEWKDVKMNIKRKGKAIVVEHKNKNVEFMAPASQVERLLEGEINGVNLSVPQ